MINGSDIKNTVKFAFAGGNLEIIKLCEQIQTSFEGSIENAVRFHHNEIFQYLYDNKLEKIDGNKLINIFKVCVTNSNYEVLSYLEGNGIKTNENIFKESSRIGNLFLFKHFLSSIRIPMDILIYSSVSGNVELIDFVLEQKGIDINAKDEDYFTNLIFHNNILDFIIIFGIYSNFLQQH